MGINRVEAEPQAIIAATIVVPFVVPRHRAIKHEMALQVLQLGNREILGNRLERDFPHRLLPPIESIMKSQSCTLQTSAVREPSARLISRTQPRHHSRHHKQISI